MSKVFKLVLTSMLIGALVLALGGAAPARAATVTVCASGCDYITIQAAVDNAADGDTIEVTDAGPYEEQVVIAGRADLTLTTSTATVQAPNSMAAFYTTSANNYPIIFVNGSSNITISGFTVDGLGRGNSNYRFNGIGYYNAGGAVLNNTIVNVMDTPFSGAQHGVALYAFNADASPRTLTVSGNTIYNYQKNGMALNGDGLTVSVTGNTVTGAGSTTVTAQNGIQLGWGATGTVSGNTIANHEFTGNTTWTAAGVLLYDVSPGVVISNNTILNSQSVISGYLGTGTQITGNTMTCSSFNSSGFDWWDMDGATISGNDISGCSRAGVYVDYGSDGTTLTGNLIHDNVIGIWYTDSSSYLPSALTAAGNCFENNGTDIQNDLPELLDATGSWWGCPEGVPTCGIVVGNVDTSSPAASCAICGIVPASTAAVTVMNDDVSLTGSAAPGAVVAGDTVAWSYTITNPTADATVGLRFLAEVAGDLSFVNANVSTGTFEYDAETGELWWEVGNVDPAVSQTIVIEAAVGEASAEQVCMAGMVADEVAQVCVDVYPGTLPLTGNGPSLTLIMGAVLAALAVGMLAFAGSKLAARCRA